MPTLYVENLPADLYEALRARAREHRKSIAAEVLSLLEETVPTPSELARRRKLLASACKIRSGKKPAGRFPTAEEMQREDRRR